MSSVLHGRNFAVGPVNNCAAYNTHLGREEKCVLIVQQSSQDTF